MSTFVTLSARAAESPGPSRAVTPDGDGVAFDTSRDPVCYFVVGGLYESHGSGRRIRGAGTGAGDEMGHMNSAFITTWHEYATIEV